VDPLLALIAGAMGASPAQVEWLFTSYIGVMSLAMLLSGVAATRIGGRKTLLLGLGAVVVFAAASGTAPNLAVLALVRGGWGLGNAFFTSTALSIIVGATTGPFSAAITLYEAALGLGIASGPLLGGFLGHFQWRLPFFGTAALMFIAFWWTFFTVHETRPEPPRGARHLFEALRHRMVLRHALIGLSYSYAFFTILAYSPLTLKGLTTIALGYTYFGWGILVAFASVYVVNRLRPVLGPLPLLSLDLAGLALLFALAGFVKGPGLLTLIVISGFFCGIANAVFTSLAMEVSPFVRSISSGAYNFLRWAGAALAPVLSGLVGESFGLNVPFWLAGAVLAGGLVVLVRSRPLYDRALGTSRQTAEET